MSLDESTAPHPRIAGDWRTRVGVVGGLSATLMLIYLSVAHLTDSATTLHTLPTPLDTAAPFSVNWLPAYLLMYVYALAPACIIDDRRLLKRWVLGTLAMYIVAVPMWLLWPVTTPRAPIDTASLMGCGLQIVRTLDPPTNCMPSMHVAVATLVSAILGRLDRAVGRLMWLGVGLIWVSTVTLDQHWFLDGLAGATLGAAAYGIALRWRPLPASAWRHTARRWHLLWLSPVPITLIGLALWQATHTGNCPVP